MSLHGKMLVFWMEKKTNENNNFSFSPLQTPQIKMHRKMHFYHSLLLSDKWAKDFWEKYFIPASVYVIYIFTYI